MSTMTMERTKREDFPTCDEFPSLTGKQTPLNLREAPGIHEHGRKNIELSRRVGLTAFPWQCHEINAINATNPDGTWVHSDAVLICPRQNGKDEVLRWADRMEWSLNPDVSFNPQNQLVEVIYPVDRLPGGIQAVVKDQLSTRMGLQFLRIA